ncbi:MAG: hypothetical protein MSC56_09820 [Clostridiales bacterium]|nr:hypothetical protein [Clostridiales bacterium]
MESLLCRFQNSLRISAAAFPDEKNLPPVAKKRKMLKNFPAGKTAA